MRFLALMFVLFIACTGQKSVTSSNNKTMTKYRVSGKVLQKSSYCGGAHPSPQVLEMYKTPKPLANYKVYLKEGLENTSEAKIIASAITDEKGRYSFELPAGNYVLVSHTQLNQANLDSVTKKENLKITNEACIATWFRDGLIGFTVSDEDIDYQSVLIFKKCDVPEGIPCLVYSGPLRP